MRRIFDFKIAFIALIIFSPLFLLISLILLTVHGRPIFFIQSRLGLFGKEFKIIKFRTMEHLNTNSPDERDISRVTKIGKWLRKTSLDEIPEFWNVLVGEMSIVGPRPLLIDYKNLYSKEQFTRHNVKPGITGWAQINGRNNLTWKEKFELDVWYVKNQTFILDIKIILLTAIKIIKMEGVNSGKEITMEKFKGER